MNLCGLTNLKCNMVFWYTNFYKLTISGSYVEASSGVSILYQFTIFVHEHSRNEASERTMIIVPPAPGRKLVILEGI